MSRSVDQFGLRLAERVSGTSWRLVEGWQKRLRDHGSRGDILQQIHAAVRGDPSRYDAVRPGEALPPEPGMAAAVVTGRVAGKGLSDELKGTFYAVVETPAGRAYHVPLDARSAQTVGVGDLVSLATPPETPVRPADRQIAEAARCRRPLRSEDYAVHRIIVVMRSAGLCGVGTRTVRVARDRERPAALHRST